jgi:vancomycin resistance protein YoaR
LHVEAGQIEDRLEALRLRRERAARARLLRRLGLATVLALAVAALVVGLVYAGSPDQLAGGERIAGVDVGGLSTTEARLALKRREAALARVPLVVHVGNETYRVRQGEIGLKIDWAAAVAEAKDKADGFGFVRGFRRMAVRAFGADVTPTARADPVALAAVLARIAGAADQPHRDAALRLDGLQPAVVHGRTGRVIDRRAARARILASFADLERRPIRLARRVDRPRVTTAMLRPVARQLTTALSAPVQLAIGPGYLPAVSRQQLARLLQLPSGGSRTLTIGGAKADAYFGALAKNVDKPPTDAGWEVQSGGGISIVPGVEGRSLDALKTAQNVLRAALRTGGLERRTAAVVVDTQAPRRTTAEARAMGIKEVVSSYTTIYGGIANRIHNVQLVAHLIDNTLIRPGTTFSFNGTTGDRNAAKGFLEAPVIINGELETGLGGGVCQVSTTVFNAAYEAGLDITARTNHALYISHYPQGRDATVDYPGVDLKFVNDTSHWLLLRTFVSSSSLAVNLYGTDPHRRVESETAPLRTTGAPPTVYVKDPNVLKGHQVVQQYGSSPLETSVHRRVYTAEGKLLHDNVWSSSYRGEQRVIAVGTKVPPKPKPKPKPKSPAILGIPPIVGGSAGAGVPPDTTGGASPPDASTPDASTPDASTPDASTPDASTPEASTPAATTPAATTPPAPVN